MAAALTLVAAAGCGAEERPPSPPPPAGATPAMVVRAYVSALDAGDEAAARRLMTPRFLRLVDGQTGGWFTNVESIRDLRVGRPILVTRGLTSTRRHRRVVYVPVEFDLTMENPSLSGFLNGPNHWGYVLVRDTPDERWRVDEDGHYQAWALRRRNWHPRHLAAPACATWRRRRAPLGGGRPSQSAAAAFTSRPSRVRDRSGARREASGAPADGSATNLRCAPAWGSGSRLAGAPALTPPRP